VAQHRRSQQCLVVGWQCTCQQHTAAEALPVTGSDPRANGMRRQASLGRLGQGQHTVLTT
jgi:hypothetical protein